MPVAKIDKQQVVGALKATGSYDPDILFARKEELLSETRKMKMLGIVPIIMGIVMTITIIGAIVGIPMMIFGFWVRGRINGNIKAAEEAYSDYMRALQPRSQSAAAQAY